MWLFSEMAKTFRTYLPEQSLLLPASLREWLPAWSPSTGRTNRHAGSVSFSYVGSKKYEENGLWICMTDNILKVSQDLFWVERQFPVPSVNGAAQRSDRCTEQSTEVAADQNQFPPSRS